MRYLARLKLLPIVKPTVPGNWPSTLDRQHKKFEICCPCLPVKYEKPNCHYRSPEMNLKNSVLCEYLHLESKNTHSKLNAMLCDLPWVVSEACHENERILYVCVN